MISIKSVVVASPQHLSSDIGDESVILNLNSGIYYGLNEVGASIWNLIQQPKTVQKIRDALIQEYEIETSQCEQEILELLEELLTSGLIEVTEVKNEAIV